MKIQEVEKELNITRANIRFYEKEGLLAPPRKENGYRDYGDEEIAQLKKIIIFRKLGISVADIKSIFDGTLSLQTAVDNNIDRLHKEIEELNGAIEVCEQIKEDNSDEKNFPQDHFWNVINNRENKGEKFNDILKDYLEFEKEIFIKHFGLNLLQEKTPFKVTMLVLFVCTVSGLMYKFVWQTGTFFEGFIYPFATFLIASIIIAPIYYFAHKKPKIAIILINIILVLGGLLFVGIALIFIVALFNTIFG